MASLRPLAAGCAGAIDGETQGVLVGEIGPDFESAGVDSQHKSALIQKQPRDLAPAPVAAGLSNFVASIGVGIIRVEGREDWLARGW